MPAEKEMPSTLRRSPAKAQRTWGKTHDSAVETYGEGERAHRTAFAAVKHSFEKVGDHWEPNDHKGLGHSRDELYQRARKLGVKGASRMKKAELAEAIAKKQ